MNRVTIVIVPKFNINYDIHMRTRVNIYIKLKIVILYFLLR